MEKTTWQYKFAVHLRLSNLKAVTSMLLSDNPKHLFFIFTVTFYTGRSSIIWHNHLKEQFKTHKKYFLICLKMCKLWKISRYGY